MEKQQVNDAPEALPDLLVIGSEAGATALTLYTPEEPVNLVTNGGKSGANDSIMSWQ